MTVAPELPTASHDDRPAGNSDDAERAGHPDWCLPTFCEPLVHPGGTEIRHLGAPLVWSMSGDDVDVVMRRQQVQNGNEARAATVEVHFAHRAFEEAITLTFTADDARKLMAGVLDLLDG